MIQLNGTRILPTVFPDKTSQIWKINPNLFRPNSYIQWDFEDEAELIQITQLTFLLQTQKCEVSLEMPYLPYARQDKPISNDHTFALHAFAAIIQSLKFKTISVLDAHSDLFINLTGAINIYPSYYIDQTIEQTKAQIVGLPDHGALSRYQFKARQTFVGKKERDPSTGNLIYLGGDGASVDKKIVLIVDDICDGGMTFILFSKILYNLGAKEVHLYTTHGIYSKGTQVLLDAGIKRIFNYRGEVK
jgi:ribose-phosphate pyrophosphokinase